MIPAAGVEAYTSLITGLAREGDMNGAFSILDVMISRGVSANARTLGALMNACMQSGRGGFQRAKELLKFEDNKYLTGLSAAELTALHGTYNDSTFQPTRLTLFNLKVHMLLVFAVNPAIVWIRIRWSY